MSVNIRFENLKCFVKEGKSGRKAIINSVNGTFYHGKLTGVLGASGAGKTTLLNILAGYLTTGVTGNVYVNEKCTSAAKRKRVATYLPQDNLVQPFLTVRESLMMVADLKLGDNDDFKRTMIQYVSVTLGLSDCLETRSDHLSGGQRKRLSIALELISDPSVIFLDEPTTGLDEVSMKLCIEWLKKLALEGKTVVCTIHQPSNSILKLFDYLYFMDNGHCIYNGSVEELVPFLSSMNFACPNTYNPADHIIEISQSSIDTRNLLIKSMEFTENERTTTDDCFNTKDDELNSDQPPNGKFWTQVSILLYRNFLQLTRNKLNIFFQCFHFTMCGLVIGGTFFDFGQDAKHLFHNFMFCIIVIVYLIFSTSIAPALTYPLEFRLFKNEISNGWYDVNAYYTSVSLISLPIPIIMGIFFTTITYLMSSQPREMERFIQFCVIVVITVIIGESHGKAVGMCCSEMYGSIVAPGTLIPSVALSFYGFGYANQLNSIVKAAMQFSFVRYSVVGVMAALYTDRDKINCSDMYCHYNDPKLFLEEMGMTGTYRVQIVVLLLFLLLYKCAVYALLRIKLNRSMK